MFWISLQLLSEIFLFLRRTERHRTKNYIVLHAEYPLFLSDFNGTWIFATCFRKILKHQISWKSVQWESSCSMRMDSRADMAKQVVAFRNFAKAPKNDTIFPLCFFPNHCDISRPQLYYLYAVTCVSQETVNLTLTFCWPCIVIYPYNKNQQDALFTFNLFR